jgi:Flp pilus assembly pilin Flp
MKPRSWGNTVRSELGQTAVEYAMVVAGVAIVLAIALAVIPGNPFSALWDTATSLF